jgi:octaprenyl-diphosphate synthase
MTEIKQKILEQVETDLSEIETALEQNLNPYLELVKKTARHLLFSGGKRLRPLLMILAARICGYSGEDDKTFSVIFEYLHTATLLHDDLVDGAALRRGKPVAHEIYGAPVAVLTGDFLLARSLILAAQTGRPEVIKTIASITEEMSQGEIHQMLNKGNLQLTEMEYLDVIRRKTAVLMQGACRTGALIANAAPCQEKALRTYGLNLGLAFQMADDLLDYTANTTQIGKEIGADIKEGKLTLPLIYTLQQAGIEDRAQMEAIIRHQTCSPEEFQLLVDLLQKYGGIDYTYQMAQNFVTTAKDQLKVFDPGNTRDVLMMLADYALIRKV